MGQWAGNANREPNIETFLLQPSCDELVDGSRKSEKMIAEKGRKAGRQFDTGLGLASECEWSKLLLLWVRHIKWTLC